MATAYSSWSANWKPSGSSVNKQYRTFLTYSTAEYPTYVVVSAYMGIELNSSVKATFTSSSLSCTGQTTVTVGSNSTVFSSSGAQLTWVWIGTQSWTIYKTTSAQTIYLGASSTSSSGSWNTTLSTSASVTIPALASYAVSYNSNGGSGTISNQTKYYGTNITLASSGFTRTYHTLTGWNTASDGTGTAYSLGGTYSGNAALALYAQWHLDYIKPTVSGIDVFRVASSSATAYSDTGLYIRIKFTYTGGTVDNGSTYIAPTCVVKINNTQVYSGTLSGSGTFNSVFGTYSENTAHTVSVQLYDSTDTTGISFTASVPAATFPIDILADGSAMGLMMAAQTDQILSAPELYSNDIILTLDDTAASGTDYEILTLLDDLDWDCTPQ